MSENISLFYPPQPKTLEDVDIDPVIIHQLLLKSLATRNSMTGGDLADDLNLPYYGIVEPILNEMRDQRLLEVTRGGMQSISYVLSITDAGRDRAAMYFQQSAYTGPAPVTFESYVKGIHAQSIRNIAVNQKRLREAFEGLVFDETILEQLGPAVNSGQSIFLYGPPGNGKTSISERIVAAFGGGIFIPFCIEINGQIIKLYDDYNHQPLMEGEDPRLEAEYDLRWRLIKRPIIVVGGELTMPSLDLIWNQESRFYEAPFQMKANGGCFMIDDFGRQRMDPKDLLNRWIVPLEKRIDFLTLHTGTKIEVPFDELIVISTNLDPKQLVDEAFLRRIRYKIPIKDPTEPNFKKIWAIMATKLGIPSSDKVVDYFIQKHLIPRRKPFRGCIPRDILSLVSDSCRYQQISPTMSAELLDAAADAYFVDLDERMQL